MRITNNMLVKEMLWNANNNLTSMAQKQRELSSGKRIHRPSDDPVGVTQVLKYKTDIREAEQYKKNITDAQGWLDVSESALHNVKDILQRIRELTVQAANGTNTPEDTQKIKVEVDELTKEILVLGNSTNAGRYVFSGLETNKKLFNDDGTYNIEMSSDRVENKYTMGYEVSVGEVMNVGVHPIDIFGVINEPNFFQDFFLKGSASTEKATQSVLTAQVKLDTDFTANGLDVTIEGITYDVDESLLVNTQSYPMTQARLLEALRDAPATAPATGKLSDVADIYFSDKDQLVIQAKDRGAVAITLPAASTGYGSPDMTLGVDGAQAVLSGSENLTDADIDAATGVHVLTFQVGDVRKNIPIDFTGLSTASDLETALQTALDGAFSGLGLTVSAVDGAPLTVTLPGSNDGSKQTMSSDMLVATQSQMINDLQALSTALSSKDDAVIQESLNRLDLHLDKVITVMGEIGGKTSRVEFIESRVAENILTFTGLLSNVQDVDMAEAIMLFKNLENIYRASLSVGSKVIQPSLVDFIR